MQRLAFTLQPDRVVFTTSRGPLTCLLLSSRAPPQHSSRVPSNVLRDSKEPSRLHFLFPRSAVSPETGRGDSPLSSLAVRCLLISGSQKKSPQQEVREKRWAMEWVLGSLVSRGDSQQQATVMSPYPVLGWHWARNNKSGWPQRARLNQISGAPASTFGLSRAIFRVLAPYSMGVPASLTFQSASQSSSICRGTWSPALPPWHWAQG